MAEIHSINIKEDEISLNLKITKKEYQILKTSTQDLVILPTDNTILTDILTTGKLGNGNRIMLPNKILKSSKITELKKKVQSKIFTINNEKYLLIKLDEPEAKIPSFESAK